MDFQDKQILASFSPAGSLRPVTSNTTARYDSSKFVSPKDVTISPGHFLYSQEPRPKYLAQQWSAHVHPEGQVYFARIGCIRIVTESWIYDENIFAKLAAWTKHIECLLQERQIPVTEQMELFISIDGEDCSYYLVDYLSRTEFWLDPLSTSDLELPAVVSESQLKLSLEGLFWTHVEHFPSHFGGLPVKDVDDLICVFSHCMTDQMTSTLSTSFYSKDSCADFLKLLKTSRRYIHDSHQTCLVARLWSMIIMQRVTTHYGEEQARLSRDQAIIFEPPARGRISKLFSIVSMGTSNYYLNRLDALFVDELIYIDQWRPFIADCLSAWNRTSLMALISLIPSIMLLSSQTATWLAFLMSVLFTSSVITSSLLVARYQSMKDSTADEVLSHIAALYSPSQGFSYLAFVYAIPFATYILGTAVLITSVFMFINIDSRVVVGLGVTLAMCLCAFARYTSESKPLYSHLPTFCRRSTVKLQEDLV